ncbi:ZmpA/ZmpB/ZmpC family metallo-endopeptidase-related protein, partial [Streptococcus suis]
IDFTKSIENKSITARYQLTNPSQNFDRAVAQLYRGEELVREIAIADPNASTTLAGLDYYTDYTLKTKVYYSLAGQKQETIQESIRPFVLEYKKIEIKDVDAVTVYR